MYKSNIKLLIVDYMSDNVSMIKSKSQAKSHFSLQMGLSEYRGLSKKIQILLGVLFSDGTYKYLFIDSAVTQIGTLFDHSNACNIE